MDRTDVAIIGGGPAGTLLSHILHSHGIENIVLEQRQRDYVLGRIRAGVLEKGTVALLRQYGLGERMDREGFVHEGVNLAFRDQLVRLDFLKRAEASVIVYGQTEIQKDLYDAQDRTGSAMVFQVGGIRIHDIDSARPYLTYQQKGMSRRLKCEFVVGCDGSHGISSAYVPNQSVYEAIYPFGWLGILSKTAPVSEELIYVNHQRGFALCSMRNLNLSRYYLQCPLDTDIDDWPDERFWDELSQRLPSHVVENLVMGPSIAKSVTPLASRVREPMHHGRLYLAGDAAHLVPPTGAKGLNLAVSDVFHLSAALIEYYDSGSTAGLNGYSDIALARVWKAVRFSWWMTNLMHRFPEEGPFHQRLQEAELDYLSSSVAAQTAMAENYVGLPF